MGRVKRLLGGMIFVLFLSAMLIRPLQSNPAIASIVSDGFSDWRNLLWVPMLVLTVLLVATRLKTTVDADEGYTGKRRDDGREEKSAWEHSIDESNEGHVDGEERGDSEERGDREGSEGKEKSREQSRPQSIEEAEAGDEYSEAERDRPSILSGQGGARDRDFEIEHEPPEAALSDHLEHLQEQLQDPEHESDLETLEEVIEEFEDDRRLPRRCPHEHCDALWAERGIIGLSSGKYDLFDDGEKVQCLECEEIYLVEEGDESGQEAYFDL